MRDIILYTTAACHLCDQAEQLIYPLLTGRDFTLRHVDIIDSEQLLEQYGVRIPVVFRPDNGGELGWPFDSVQVQRFIDN